MVNKPHCIPKKEQSAAQHPSDPQSCLWLSTFFTINQLTKKASKSFGRIQNTLQKNKNRENYIKSPRKYYSGFKLNPGFLIVATKTQHDLERLSIKLIKDMYDETVTSVVKD